MVNKLALSDLYVYIGCAFPYMYHLESTVIREIFVVKNFSFHPKRRKFLTRILFTNSIIRNEYMAHTLNRQEYCYMKISNIKYLQTKIMRITVFHALILINAVFPYH